MKKQFFLVLLVFLNLHHMFSLSKEVESVLLSLKDKDADSALEYLESRATMAQVVQDKRDLLVFTASLQERSGFYELAAKTYEKAAALQSSGTSESSASLVVNAARCALSMGNTQLADTYLSAVARTAVSAEVSSKIKLYAVWSWLSKITDESSLHEPMVILKSYVDMKGMETVQSSILLTLWYLSGDESYSNKLRTAYPDSMETAVIQGRAQLLPTPFWFFLPRKAAVPLLESESLSLNSAGTAGEKSGSNTLDQQNDQKAVEKKDEGSTIILHYQLGFFRNKENAQELVQRLQKAGFNPAVQEEKRQSGTIYYAVIVKENETNDMGARLKNSGFECYPVFK